MNELVIELLEHPFISKMAIARIMNPANTQRIYNQLRTKKPKFTPEEIRNLQEAGEGIELMIILQEL